MKTRNVNLSPGTDLLNINIKTDLGEKGQVKIKVTYDECMNATIEYCTIGDDLSWQDVPLRHWRD